MILTRIIEYWTGVAETLIALIALFLERLLDALAVIGA